MKHSTAIVIGAGIVGMATARALALKGYKVKLIERNQKAVGASIRNFGMVWPVGQPDGILYHRAVRSKEIWKEIADAANIWYDEKGSLHLAHKEDEWEVLQELEAAFSQAGRSVKLLHPNAIQKEFSGINHQHLLGGLYSSTEMIVDPRAAIAKIPEYLQEHLGIECIWDTAITDIETGRVKAGKREFHADLICVCSGQDFETLYPEQFAEQPITKCKLQMMRFKPESPQWRIGTAICGGLSLVHYPSFKVAASLQKLKSRYNAEMSAFMDKGIHVMVSQNEKGELTVGDSHEYAGVFDPFDEAEINELIIGYLKEFASIEKWKLVQTWHGIYPKMTNGATEMILRPEPGVFVINGLGGNGMTLSFGLAEEAVEMF